MGQGRRLLQAVEDLFAGIRPPQGHRLDVAVAGQRNGLRTGKRGDETGKNPTDRGKLGTKRHFIVDGQGIPLGVTLSGANVHDKKRFGATMDSLIIPRPSTRSIEQHLCADKGYDYDDIRLSAKRRRYIAHIPQRGVAPTPRKAGQKAHRWVVERTNRWHNLFRRLKIRYEVYSRNYLAFVHLANTIICFRRARA
jgi:putative transposase